MKTEKFSSIGEMQSKEKMKDDLQCGQFTIDHWVWQHSWTRHLCVPAVCQLQERPPATLIYTVIHPPAVGITLIKKSSGPLLGKGGTIHIFRQVVVSVY